MSHKQEQCLTRATKGRKKGFNWGKLIKYGLEAVAVDASVLTFGLGATIAIIAVSAIAVGACVAGDVVMQTSTFAVDVLSFGTFHNRAEKASQW